MMRVSAGVVFSLISKAVADDWCAISIHGYNCAGNDIAHVGGITTHQDCCNACNEHSGCNAWTWHFPTQDCYLKSACNNQTSSSDDHSSQPKPSPPSPPSPPPPTPRPPPSPSPSPSPSPNDWCAKDAHGYDCQGNDIGHVGGITQHMECCNACLAKTGCKAWTWHYPTQDCYLKSACNNVSASTEYHSSYPFSPSPPPAPTPPSSMTGRCGLAVVDSEANEITNGGWLNAYGDSIGFWYNWDGNTGVTVRANGKVVPYIPMWWGSQVWSQHPAQQSWCSNSGHTGIPAKAGEQGFAFAWNEPCGGSSCTYSMGACPGGGYSGTVGATRATQNYGSCLDGARAANRLVSTPCLNNLDPAWFRAWHGSRSSEFISKQSKTVCCSHVYASQYNNAGWESCDWNAMTNMDKLAGELQGLKNDGTCDYHFIQEIGIGGCKSADATVTEALMENLGNAVRNIPSVYLGWFANSAGAGDTARRTTWPFEENTGTIGTAFQAMCKSLQPAALNESLFEATNTLETPSESSDFIVTI